MLPFLAPLLAAAPISGPIKFDLVLDKPAYAPGQPILVSLTAKNISNRPATLVKAIWDGAPAASANATLLRNGKPIETFGDSSSPALQVMVSDRVDKSRFLVVLPGQTATLFWTKFEGERVFQGQARDKQAYAQAKTRQIAPGAYEVVGTYQFDPAQIASELKRDFKMNLTFAPGARALWDSAEKAKVSVSRKLEIR